jgi:tetratricopeptide (TPR) repeat protein
VSDEIHQQFSGSAENVVQIAHADHVHLAIQELKRSQAYEVPVPVRHYTNFDTQRKAVTATLRPLSGDLGPAIMLISGEPGSGKTQLASQCAYENSDRYSDGIFYAPLAETSDPQSTLTGWLSHYYDYGYNELPPSLSGVQRLWRSVTRGKRVLVVIDDALKAEDAEALLPGHGESAALVVSTGRFDQFIARHAVHEIKLSPLQEDQALALLGHRIGQERVAAERESAKKLAEICGYLPGPLNISGAMLSRDEHRKIAALVRRLTNKGVVTHLGLTVLYDAAFDRLSAEAKQVYRVLGAHPGAHLMIGVPAVASVLGMDPDDAEEALDELFEASLVGSNGAARYQLSTLVATHAATKASGDLVRFRESFVAYYRDYGLRCAEKLTPNRGFWRGITPVADRTQALDWLVGNGPAIVASAVAAEEAGADESVVMLCLASWPLDILSGNLARMVRLNLLGVEAARNLGNDALRSVLHTQLGFGYRDQKKWALARDAFETAMTLGTRESMATGREGLALMYRNQGQPEQARPLLVENLEIAKTILADKPQDPSARRRVRLARFHLSTVESPAVAVRELREVLTEFAKDEDERNQAKVNYWLGLKLLAGGAGPAAVEPLTAATELARSNKMAREEGVAHRALADADPDNAEAHLREASRILRVGFPDDDAEVQARMTELGLDFSL